MDDSRLKERLERLHAAYAVPDFESVVARARLRGRRPRRPTWVWIPVPVAATLALVLWSLLQAPPEPISLALGPLPSDFLLEGTHIGDLSEVPRFGGWWAPEGATQ